MTTLVENWISIDRDGHQCERCEGKEYVAALALAGDKRVYLCANCLGDAFSLAITGQVQ